MADNSNDSGTSKIILAVLAIFIPPLAVAIKQDGCDGHFWLSVLLTIFLFLPGVLHALYIVFK